MLSLIFPTAEHKTDALEITRGRRRAGRSAIAFRINRIQYGPSRGEAYIVCNDADIHYTTRDLRLPKCTIRANPRPFPSHR